MTDDNEDFFEIHGVGNMPAEPNDTRLQTMVNVSEATPNERMFVRSVLSGDSQTEAYLKVYDRDGTMSRSKASSNASYLMKRPRVAEYYTLVLEERNAMAEETLPRLMQELNDDRQLARDMGQPSAAIQAVKAKANLLGLENKPDNITMNFQLNDKAKEQLLARMGEMVTKKGNMTIDADYKDITPNED